MNKALGTSASTSAIVMSSEVETSLDISEIVSDSSAVLGMTK
jgi:hypothetical protein